MEKLSNIRREFTSIDFDFYKVLIKIPVSSFRLFTEVLNYFNFSGDSRDDITAQKI